MEIIKTPRGEMKLEDGVLKKYKGEDEELTLPEGIRRISRCYDS